MFFRREKIKPLSYNERIDALRASGCTCERLSDRTTRASRNGMAVIVAEGAAGQPEIVECGLMIDGELGLLTDLGYQKVFRTPGGKQAAAQAEHLAALHAFVEDVRSTLGITSLYNTSLGTTNEKHLYDRVEDRDKGVARRAWER